MRAEGNRTQVFKRPQKSACVIGRGRHRWHNRQLQFVKGRVQAHLFRDRLVLQLLCNNPAVFVETMEKVAAGKQLCLPTVDANSGELGSISFHDAPLATLDMEGLGMAAATAKQGLKHRTIDSLSPGELAPMTA